MCCSQGSPLIYSRCDDVQEIPLESPSATARAVLGSSARVYAGIWANRAADERRADAKEDNDSHSTGAQVPASTGDDSVLPHRPAARSKLTTNKYKRTLTLWLLVDMHKRSTK
jgi:hypothetical protein